MSENKLEKKNRKKNLKIWIYLAWLVYKQRNELEKKIKWWVSSSLFKITKSQSRKLNKITYCMVLYSSRILSWTGCERRRKSSKARVCNSVFLPDLFRPAKPSNICSSDTRKLKTILCNTAVHNLRLLQPFQGYATNSFFVIILKFF